MREERVRGLFITTSLRVRKNLAKNVFRKGPFDSLQASNTKTKNTTSNDIFIMQF